MRPISGIIRRCVIAVSAIFLLCPTPASALECKADTYNNTEFTEPLSRFSPYDKIYVIVRCLDIPSGTYTMHANWLHTKRGVIRSSDTYDFTMATSGNRSVYFWLKLQKKGPLASAFSNEDFNAKNFGDWRVEIYLNDGLVVSRDFAIVQGD